MELFLIILLLVVGLALIIKGGDVFVDASAWIAEALGLPKFIVGATIVSVATTLPEFLVSLFASIKGNAGICIGNAIGSVTANIGLIFGILLVFSPAVMPREKFWQKSVLMIAACTVLFAFGFTKVLPWYACIILLIIFALFIFVNVREAKKAMYEQSTEEIAAVDKSKKTVIINIIKFVLGAAAIAGGAILLNDNGEKLARLAGVPDSIIGATIIAIGTSLPELVTAITAIVKKQGAISIGNIIGANVIDLAVILPVCSLIGMIGGQALNFTLQSAYLDLPVCLGFCLMATVPTIISQKLQRWQGITLLTCYVAYVVTMCVVQF